MSFRLFIYYCALCGAWAALFGWALGRAALEGQAADEENRMAEAGIQGMCLGLFVSLGLSLIDSLWNLSVRQFAQIGLRVLVAVMIGSIGGMIGGVFGQALFGWVPLSIFLIAGWSLTGLLIGASIGVFEVIHGYLKNEPLRVTLRKIVNGVLGGTLGGMLGGVLSVVVHAGWTRFFRDRPMDDLWSPSATGFVALGLCIGLLIGLAQVILKEAWLKVESGKRAGREMILSKREIIIGRAEACDIGLFGDNSIERNHAQIMQQNNRYYLADLGTPGGTYLNGLRIAEPTPLRSGDTIRLGSYVLRFGERRKHTPS